jgi:4-coumarate--CoA ligase
MLILSIVINAEIVILPNFTMKGLLDTITKYRIAEVQMVPPIIIRMVRDPLVDQYDLSCIKRFASGAAPISAEVLRLLEEKFLGRGFKQGYGMTESTGCITTHPIDKHAFKYARTGGTLCANTLVKVVNDKGKVVGIDEKGEVISRKLEYQNLDTDTEDPVDSSKRSANRHGILQQSQSNRRGVRQRRIPPNRRRRLS